MLLPCKEAIPLLPEVFSHFAQRQHIAVRPAALRNMVLPFFAPVEHVQQGFPVVPEIVGNAPHIGILFIVPAFRNLRRSGRKAQHDGPPATLDGPAQHLHLVPAPITPVGMESGGANIIHLNEIHAPCGIELHDGIVIFLSGFAIADAVHIRVPLRNGVGVCNHIRSHIRSQYGQMVLCSSSGNASHDMDTKFQIKGMDFVSQRFKSRPIDGRREFIRARQQSAKFVHLIFAEGYVLEPGAHGCGVVGIPLDVNHHILPTVGFQMFCHKLCIGQHIRLGYIGVVIVVAVPAHWWTLRKAVLIHPLHLAHS